MAQITIGLWEHVVFVVGSRREGLAMASNGLRPEIFVVDSRELRRAAIIGLISEWADSEGLTLLSLSPEAAMHAFESEPDCRMVLLSIGAESVMGREIAQRIKVIKALAASAPIVVVSDICESEEVIAALNAGVQGYVPTEMNPKLALQAISFIYNGGSYFPPEAIRGRADSPCEPDVSSTPPITERRRALSQDGSRESHSIPPDPDVSEFGDHHDTGCQMTSRQRQVLVLVRQGLPNKLIARRLSMTEATVKVHVRQIMRKLGVVNRTQIAVAKIDDLDATNENGSAGSESDPPQLGNFYTPPTGLHG